MNSLKTKFGKRLKELRKSRGMTQEQMAEFINIEPPNLSKIECGMHFPQPEKLEKIALALNIEVQELFDFEHLQKKQTLIKNINDILLSLDIKKVELVYKFVKNLKILK